MKLLQHANNQVTTKPLGYFRPGNKPEPLEAVREQLRKSVWYLEGIAGVGSKLAIKHCAEAVYWFVLLHYSRRVKKVWVKVNVGQENQPKMTSFFSLQEILTVTAGIFFFF